MFLHIVPTYAAILALIYVALSAYVIRGRWTNRVLFGAGGNDDMSHRVRMHGNFAEYVPFALLILAMAEMRGASDSWMHALCSILIVARLTHMVGIYKGNVNPFRAIGMIGTLGVFTAAALLILMA